MTKSSVHSNSGKIIRAVLGDIAPEDLGFCQSHEHLFIRRGLPAEINPLLCIDDLPRSLTELEGYYRSGGRALVDAQPPGCGRDPGMLAELSRRSGVHIIASTGFHRRLYYPEDHWIFTISADAFTRFCLTELNTGMYREETLSAPQFGMSAGNGSSPQSGMPAGDGSPPQSGMPAGNGASCGGQNTGRAGQIKTALEAGPLDRQSKKLFTATAAASGESGCALMVHVEPEAAPAALADFLLKQGLPPSRLIFCHLDRAVGDLGVHRELCRRGAWLEYDTIGRPKYHSDEREAEIVLEMAEAGFSGQILMSLDTTRARLGSYGGSPGLGHIIESFIPLLKDRGLGEEDLRMFFIENPAGAFARGANP
jgi:phosphotriesterase-related protein